MSSYSARDYCSLVLSVFSHVNNYVTNFMHINYNHNNNNNNKCQHNIARRQLMIVPYHKTLDCSDNTTKLYNN